MAQAHVAFASRASLPHAAVARPARVPPPPQVSVIPTVVAAAGSFKRGTLLLSGVFSSKRKSKDRKSSSIRCEQNTKENTELDVWLGRLAMMGFATAITVEVATGKGLLENFGFLTPVPTLALVVTALVGLLTAFFIFQSASRN